MNDPGTFVLANLSLTAALTGQVQTPIGGLDGMFSANVLAEVIGFTGGTGVSVTVRVSRDGGSTWLDAARFDFSDAGKAYANLQRAAAKGVTAYAALDAQGVNDALFGPLWCAVVTTVGVFSDTLLRVTLDAA